jgi:cytosine deaminase
MTRTSASPLPPLRLPRSLLDPLRSDLPAGDADGLVAVRLEHAEGRFTALRPHRGDPGELLPLALTPPLEPHAHLDKAFTWEAYPNRGGTMAGALAANEREHTSRTAEAVSHRAEQALQRAWRQGLRGLRSHVDSLGPGAAASWEALLSLQHQWRERLPLQLVALVPVRHWSTPEGQQLGRRLVAAGDGQPCPAGVLLGGVLGAPYPPDGADAEGLLALLRLADGLGCSVDLHVDESAGGGGAGVSLVARLVRQHRIAVPVTCSHACGMSQLAPRRCQALADSMAEAGVSVVALPATNLWLLGSRTGATPALRPMAPVRQLQRAGVTVAVGGDNVQDPWFPGGDFDPLELLRLSLPAAHLAPWSRQGLSPFTTAAARLMRMAWDGVVREGAPADLVMLAASGWSDLLARSPRRRVLRAGRWLPEAEPPPLLHVLEDLR